MAAGTLPQPNTVRFVRRTRPYDLVRKFVVALVVVALLTLGLSLAFSSPDDKALTLRTWADAAPNDVVATATAELAGTSPSATYGPPYNTNGAGQNVVGVPLQAWGGVRILVNSADLVLQPLSDAAPTNRLLARALRRWSAAPGLRRTNWAHRYADALTRAPGGSPATVAPGLYGPVPQLANAFLAVARSGGLEGALTSSGTFYGGDQTRALLLLSDGAYLENQARARQLGGDQWGMMNETGNYPGQPWLWLYTFWYQVPPFATSANADAQVWALMALLTLALVLLPAIPGLRSIPRWIPLHRLIWRSYYRAQSRPVGPRP